MPLTLRMKVYDLNGDDATVLKGAAVYVWHCDREGPYSMYSGSADENYLRGVQATDAKGWVEFTTIFPAAYSGRWPHVHFEVYEYWRSDQSSASTSCARRSSPFQRTPASRPMPPMATKKQYVLVVSG